MKDQILHNRMRKIKQYLLGKKKQREPVIVEEKPSDVISVSVLKDDVTEPITINSLKSEWCSGCGACVNICPVDAIVMKRDSEGYLLPNLYVDKCVHCKKCAQICPVINVPKSNKEDPSCYAVMADDETRKVSSSGGAFTLLAKYVLEQGGYICGAALDEKFVVRHIIVDDVQELSRLRGSKYVQSHTGDSYVRIKKLLNEGKTVLFTGCPCQVAGLNNFLNKKYDNLITADLLCHGTPSQKCFDRYIEDNYGDSLEGFEFRTKKYGYNCVNQIAYLKDGSEIGRNIAFDAYEKCMHSGLALKSVCEDCPFATVPRQGDFTIGDFWGISAYNPSYNDGLGTSVVLLNNQSAEKVWAKIKERCKLAEPVPFEVARNNNRFGSHVGVPNGRHWFFHMLDNKPFNEAVDYALNRKFDVAVVGLWFGLNYGSMATYYALHHVLKSMGLSVLMVENCLRPDSEDVEAKTHPNRLMKSFYDISRRYAMHDLKVLNNHCDAFIVGSDQLWNVNLSRPYRQMFYLDFVDDNKNKISFSTSFGTTYHGTEEEKLISSHYLRRFDHVSVRDSLSKEICKDFGVEATELCDPTLLCDSYVYEPILEQANLKYDGEYIFAYILDPTEEVGRFLHEVAVERDCKVLVALDLYPPLWETRRKNLHVDQYSDVEVCSDVDLSEWLWYYKNASAIITDSFHGTIFSILYEKPFVTKCNYQRGAERFVSLLTPLGLENHLFEAFDNYSNVQDFLLHFDYVGPKERLQIIRKNALSWLRDALHNK